MTQTASGLGARLAVRISPADVGRRVTVRHRVTGQGSTLTDVVGVLDSWPEGHTGVLSIRRRDGRVARVPAVDVVAARVVAPEVSAYALQAVAQAGWPPLETQPLGGWELRWSGGVGGRGNSVRVGGDPGLPWERALGVVRRWYAERGGSAQLQVPHPGTHDALLDDLGWRERRRTYVLTTALPRLLVATTGRTERLDVRVTMSPTPSAPWLAALTDADTGTIEQLAVVLTAPRVAAFCEVRSAADGALLAIGRGSVQDRWLGVTSVETVLGARRIGLASAVMGALAAWGHDVGADRSYLQVFATNTGALALYDRLGYTRHHAYVYRPDPQTDPGPRVTDPESAV